MRDMGLYVLLYCLLVMTAAYLLFRRRKKVIEISLEELSTIWLRYNDDVAPVEATADKLGGLYGQGDSAGEGVDREGDVGDAEGAPKEKEPERKSETGKVETDPLVRLTEWLKPYMEEFKAQGVDGILSSLVDELALYGQCPSVVLDSRDSESVELYSVRDNLARVTLKDHTFHVTGKMLDLAHRTYGDFKRMVPMVVITALAHDIGKVPERYASGVYNTRDHPRVSSARLMEMASGEMKGIPWFSEALKAITDHHRPTRDQFTSLLKRADRKAREMELLKFTSSFSVKSTEEWFDVAGLIGLIEPHVNILKRGRWTAFTFNGVVFCHPDLVYEMTKNLCREAKAIDLTFVYESEKENALRRVAGILKEKDYLVDVLRQNHYAAKVEVRSASGRKRFVLVPIKGEFFGGMPEIEKRKTGYLESIREVKYL